MLALYGRHFWFRCLKKQRHFAFFHFSNFSPPPPPEFIFFNCAYKLHKNMQVCVNDQCLSSQCWQALTTSWYTLYWGTVNVKLAMGAWLFTGHNYIKKLKGETAERIHPQYIFVLSAVDFVYLYYKFMHSIVLFMCKWEKLTHFQMAKVCCLLNSFVDLRTLPGGMKEKQTFLYHAVTFFLLILVSHSGSRKIKLEFTLTLKTSFYPAEFRFCVIVTYYMGQNHGQNTFDYLNEFSVR